jgi:multidrug efflux pump subunit AcrA (membrane-fusion protein)
MNVRARVVAGCVLTSLLLGTAPADAHEGHDHGAPEPQASDPSLVVRSASNASYEVVLKYPSVRGQKTTPVRVYLSDFATNAPVEAQVAIRTTSPRQISAEGVALSPGVYEALVQNEQPGRFTLILSVAGAATAEFAFQDLPMGEAMPGGGSTTARPAPWQNPWLIGLLVAALGGAAILLRRRAVRPVSRTALVLITLAGLMAPPRHLTAHEGHDHGAPPAQTAPAGPAQPRYMPKESQFLFGVRTTIGRLETLRTRINAIGHVVPESGALARVEAPRDGRLEGSGRRLTVGDRVRRGEVVAHLLVIDRLPIRAPISGLIAEVHFTPGQWVQAGAPLLVILDERQVRVELPLFGENLNRALRAQVATVTTTALPGTEFTARVRGLAPTAPEPAVAENEPAAGSPIPPVLLSVENRGGLLRPGMLVEASLELPMTEELIAVPEGAVIQHETGAAIFVHTAPEVFEQRAVRIIGRYGSRLGVAGGIAPGERIVVEGAQSLVSAPPVQASAAADSAAGAAR